MKKLESRAMRQESMFGQHVQGPTFAKAVKNLVILQKIIPLLQRSDLAQFGDGA